MTVKRDGARIVPWVIAAALWVGETRAAGVTRRPRERRAGLLDCATVCVTVWALLATFAPGSGRLREVERRQDECDETWALYYRRDEAARRRARMHSVQGRLG